MNRILRRVRRYLAQPRTGAALLYAAIAFVILGEWVQGFFAGNAPLETVLASTPAQVWFAWSLVSFVISAWMAFVLLRRRPTARMSRRLLLVAVAHAVGAIRFYDWGLVLLSVLPVFALLATVLLPEPEQAPR